MTHFLGDARRRDLPRATGPVHQFRRIRLQERLAGPSSQPGVGFFSGTAVSTATFRTTADRARGPWSR
ncbi:hypothetical protein ALMP_07260 [Streptomyces sp. A012304]|nr:hypothetical protein ALMP_07260 [Streptomyces sp. A012304]